MRMKSDSNKTRRIIPAIMLLIVIVGVSACLTILLFPWFRPYYYHTSEDVMLPSNYQLWNVLCALKRDLTREHVMPGSQKEYCLIMSNRVAQYGYCLDDFRRYHMSYSCQPDKREFEIVVVISNIMPSIVVSSENEYPAFCFSNCITRRTFCDELLQVLGTEPHFSNVETTREKLSMLNFLGYDLIIQRYLEERVSDPYENRGIKLLARRLLYCQMNMKRAERGHALLY